jgi:hypothetical protein
MKMKRLAPLLALALLLQWLVGSQAAWGAERIVELNTPSCV